MKKAIIIMMSLSLVIEASAQLKNFDKYGKVPIRGEQTYLKIEKQNENLKDDKHSFVAIAAAVLPAVIDYGVALGKHISKKNIESFIGTYKCANSGSGFYVDNMTVALPKLTIVRDVMLDNGNASINASTIILTPELSDDKMAFRYKIEKVIYNYAKAKTKKSYYLIDLDIQIQIKSITFAKEKYEVTDLRTTTLAFPMMEVGSEYNAAKGKARSYSGWIPMLPKSIVSQKLYGKTPPETSTKTVVKSVQSGKTTKEETTTETTTLTDQSKVSDVSIARGAGQYEIEVTVVETNPYKIKAEYKSELIENTSESGTKLLKTVIETLLKKDSDTGDESQSEEGKDN